jgi:hypothetical protein
VNIELRVADCNGVNTVRGVWKIDVPVSVKAAEMAQRLNIDLEGLEGERLTRVEDALVKLNLREGKESGWILWHRIFYRNGN